MTLRNCTSHRTSQYPGSGTDVHDNAAPVRKLKKSASGRPCRRPAPTALHRLALDTRTTGCAPAPPPMGDSPTTVRPFLMVMELSLIRSDCTSVCGDWVEVDESSTKLRDVIWRPV